MTVFRVGDRIKGKPGTHQKGKTGIVTETPIHSISNWIVVQWDNGKRPSVTRKRFIELED